MVFLLVEYSITPSQPWVSVMVQRFVRALMLKRPYVKVGMLKLENRDQAEVTFFQLTKASWEQHLQQLSLGTEQCLHGLWALLEVAHPANGLRLLDQLAVTPMNHLVVRLPPAAVLCELEAWRKTLLLLLGLVALTQDLPIILNKHLNSCRCSTKNCSIPLFFTKAVMQQNTIWCFKPR